MDALLLLAFVFACPALLILTCALLLYGIPVRSSIRLLVQEGDLRESITVAWGLVGVRIQHDPQGTKSDLIVGRHVLYTYKFMPEGAPSPKSGKEEETEEDKGAHTQFTYSRIGRLAKSLLQPAKSLIYVIWKESRFDSMQGKITLGTGDPALTGELCGYYWAARFMLEAMHIHLEFEPIFDRKVFSCDLEVNISLHHPLLVLIAAVRLVLHPAAREMIALSRQGVSGAVAA